VIDRFFLFVFCVVCLFARLLVLFV